jgi:hypothetical protein
MEGLTWGWGWGRLVEGSEGSAGLYAASLLGHHVAVLAKVP